MITPSECYSKQSRSQTCGLPTQCLSTLTGGGLELDDYATFLGLPAKAVMGQRNKGAHLLTPGNLVQDVTRFSHNYLFLDPDTGIYDHEVGDNKTHNSRPVDQNHHTEGRQVSACV